MKSQSEPNEENNQKSYGTVTVEGNYATLRYKRRLFYPREEVWKAITDPDQISAWFTTKAIIEGRKGGTIDFISGPSSMHTTGLILTWDPPHIFEHEWHIDPNSDLPAGEPDSVIRWELVQEDTYTLLNVTFSRLTKNTALGFAPGTHVFLDRLEAYLNHEVLPEWIERYEAVKRFYPTWQRK
jgi:uncharacterized protein YndB with AHSA1/START domain